MFLCGVWGTFVSSYSHRMDECWSRWSRWRRRRRRSLFALVAQRQDVFLQVCDPLLLNRQRPVKHFIAEPGRQDKREWTIFPSICHLFKENLFLLTCIWGSRFYPPVWPVESEAASAAEQGCCRSETAAGSESGDFHPPRRLRVGGHGPLKPGGITWTKKKKKETAFSFFWTWPFSPLAVRTLWSFLLALCSGWCRDELWLLLGEASEFIDVEAKEEDLWD